MSRGMSVAVVVLVLTVAAVTAEPGFKVKGRCRPQVRYVPVYKTVVNKVSLVPLTDEVVMNKGPIRFFFLAMCFMQDPQVLRLSNKKRCCHIRFYVF